MDEKTPIEIENENRQKFVEAAKAAGMETETTPEEKPADNGDKSNGDTDPKNDKPNPDSVNDNPDPTDDQPAGDEPKKDGAAKVEPVGDKPVDGAEDDDFPVAMSKKHAEKWKTLDADMKAEVKRVLENDQQTITRFKTKNKTLEDAIAVANPEIYADVKNFGISREQSIKNRLSLVSRFERNPDETLVGIIAGNEVRFNNPAGLIRAIAAATKTDLETLAKVDPQVAQLEDKAAAYEARQRAEKVAQQRRADAESAMADDELVDAARAFRANHPDVEITKTFQRQMDAVAVSIVAENPTISAHDLFEQAYAVIQGLSHPTATPATTTAVKPGIPKKPVVSLTPSDDVGEKTRQMNIDVNDPDARRKFFNKMARAAGYK